MSVDSISDAIARLESHGDFASDGVVPLPFPLAEIDGYGPLALPLRADAVDGLRAVSSPAPYGLGTETLVDDNVRRALQVDADSVTLSEAFEQVLATIVERLREALGIPGEVVASFYKLVVYPSGGHFVAHRDTEKEPGMFGTLVVGLPSVHTGGVLRVRHRGVERTVDFSSLPYDALGWCAFYADCEHEVGVVESGARAVLLFNLASSRSVEPPSEDDDAVEAVGDALDEWTGLHAGIDDLDAKIVVLLDHQYTRAELAWGTLKGRDHAVGNAIRRAADTRGWETGLALVERRETWAAEALFAGRGWRRSYYDDRPVSYEPIELCDMTQEIAYWAPGRWGDAPRLRIRDKEICPAGALDGEPDSESGSGPTGNEGSTLERFYGRAAIIVWPAERSETVFSVAAIADLVHAARSRRQRDSQDRVYIDAAASLDVNAHPSGSVVDLIGFAVELGDEALTEALGHSLHGWTGAFDGAVEPLRRLAATLPRPDGIALLVDIVRATPPHGRYELGPLIEPVAGDAEGQRAWRPAVDALLEALGATQYRREAGVRSALRAVARLDDPAVGDAAWEHLAGLDETTLVDQVVPALLATLAEVGRRDASGALIAVAERVVAHLQPSHGTAPVAPTTWVRPAPIRCRCEHCSELGAFMADGGASTWTFRAREDLRRHVETTIQRDRLDASATTVRVGSPYRLEVRKTSRSHELALRRWQDVERLIGSLGTGS